MILAQCRYTTPVGQTGFLPPLFIFCSLHFGCVTVSCSHACHACVCLSDVLSTLEVWLKESALVQLSGSATLPAAGRGFTICPFKSVSAVSRVTQHLSEVTLCNKHHSEMHKNTLHSLHLNYISSIADVMRAHFPNGTNNLPLTSPLRDGGQFIPQCSDGHGGPQF